MAWRKLDSIDTLDKIIEDSQSRPQFIYKHSTRCSISFMAMSRLEAAAKKSDIFIIDVINHRDISNAVEQKLSVIHQSPQLLVIHGRRSIFDASHMAISAATIERHLTEKF